MKNRSRKNVSDKKKAKVENKSEANYLRAKSKGIGNVLKVAQMRRSQRT